MAGHPFEIVLAHLDGLVEVKLRGDFDHSATVQHANTLHELAALRSRVVIDLAQVDFIDSAGIAFLIRLSVGHDCPIQLDNVPRDVARVLHVSGLDSLFQYNAPS